MDIEHFGCGRQHSSYPSGTGTMAASHDQRIAPAPSIGCLCCFFHRLWSGLLRIRSCRRRLLGKARCKEEFGVSFISVKLAVISGLREAALGSVFLIPLMDADY